MLHNLIETIIMPPTSTFLGVVIGALCLRRWRKLGISIIAISIFFLYLLSTSIGARSLLSLVQYDEPLKLGNLPNKQAQAIVLLAGGTKTGPEYDGKTVSTISMDRARYAALLYKKTKLPILIAGGSSDGDPSKAKLIGEIFTRDFSIPVRWLEEQSANTFENAQNSKKILEANGIKQFYLVTSAWHMPRALWAFHQVGLNPIPAPTDYIGVSNDGFGIDAWIPGMSELSASDLALHEVIGSVWYRLYYK